MGKPSKPIKVFKIIHWSYGKTNIGKYAKVAYFIKGEIYVQINNGINMAWFESTIQHESNRYVWKSIQKYADIEREKSM